jgi:mRNA interferase RelE/StbE
VANYKVLIKPSVAKEMQRIPDPDFSRLTEKIRHLSSHPRHKGCEKLSRQEKYRIRQGNYRITYLIDDSAKEIIIYKIGHRRDIYKMKTIAMSIVAY